MAYVARARVPVALYVLDGLWVGCLSHYSATSQRAKMSVSSGIEHCTHKITR
jgi:hypothetical protein